MIPYSRLVPEGHLQHADDGVRVSVDTVQEKAEGVTVK
jgi:hypothetical protein